MTFIYAMTIVLGKLLFQQQVSMFCHSISSFLLGPLGFTWTKHYCTYEKGTKAFTMSISEAKSGGKVVSIVLTSKWGKKGAAVFSCMDFELGMQLLIKGWNTPQRACSYIINYRYFQSKRSTHHIL